MSTKLPPLPQSAYAFTDPEGERPDIPAFSADQMRIYALDVLAERKPLTDEQVARITRGLNESLSGYRGWGWIDVARAIERAHGIGE